MSRMTTGIAEQVSRVDRDISGHVELYAKHVDQVFHFFLLSVGNSETAEVLTQEVFRKVWRSAHCAHRHTTLEITQNAVCILQHQSAGTSKRAFARLHSLEVEQLVENVPTNSLERRGLALVLDVLRRSSLERRSTFLFRFTDDLSLAEIAHIMKRSIPEVQGDICSALEEVRRGLRRLDPLSQSMLTSVQLEALLRDSPYRRQVWRHIESSAACRSEVEGLAHLLSCFRVSSTLYAEAQLRIQDAGCSGVEKSYWSYVNQGEYQ